MKFIVILLFVSIFLVDYLFKELGVVSRHVALLPDLLSVLAMCLIVIRFLVTKQLEVHLKYWLFFAILGLHLFLGIILNTVSTGAVFSGLRTYFRYLPFFLVPAVYEFSNDDLKMQLKFLLMLALLQFPLVIYQRFFQYAGKNSGDDIAGTLILSSHLSIVLISAMAITFAFYLKKRLSVKTLVVILILLFIPTTLNETKGSLFLMPLAVIIPAVLIGDVHRRFATVAPVLLMGVLLFGAFVMLYNQSLGQTRDRSITEFFAEGGAKEYLYKEATGKGSVIEEIGRVDSMVLAFKKLSVDVGKLGFGLGIGNVSESFSKVLEGEYSKQYAHMLPQLTSVSFLLWETGLIGVILVVAGCYLVFADARYLSKSDSTYGALALGWAAIVGIYVVSLGYKNLVTPGVIGYSFWYFSGCVAAARLRWQTEENASR